MVCPPRVLGRGVGRGVGGGVGYGVGSGVGVMQSSTRAGAPSDLGTREQSRHCGEPTFMFASGQLPFLLCADFAAVLTSDLVQRLRKWLAGRPREVPERPLLATDQEVLATWPGPELFLFAKCLPSWLPSPAIRTALA